MNLPNLISLARLFAVPLAVWLILRDRLDLAFWLFVAAGISDALDGYLARRLNALTTLGRYLDPMADKMLLVCTFVTLGLTNLVAPWLVILVVARDVMIVGAMLMLVLMHHPLKAQPSMISKANTAAQMVFAVLILARHGFALDAYLTDTALTLFAYFVGATTLASWAGYSMTWLRHVAMMEEE